jgi:predicted flap endonuclease-1-like 5' DNA nuclease
MSKNKISKKVLKAFLSSIKKIESIDLKGKYEDAGKIFTNYALILKHKEGKKSKLIKLIKAISEDTGVSDILEKVKSKKKTDIKEKIDTKGKKTQTKSKKHSSRNSVKSSDEKVTSPNGSSSKNEVAKPKKMVKVAKADKKPNKAKKTKIPQLVKPPARLIAKPAPSKVAVTKDVSPPKIEVVNIKKVIKPVVRKPIAKTPNKAPTKLPIKTVSVVKQITAKGKGDNLTLIEGISSKIESFLKEDGIDTFDKLAKAVPEFIHSMLISKGGKRYNAYNPERWPEQATLAAKGDMAALKALKLSLKKV